MSKSSRKGRQKGKNPQAADNTVTKSSRESRQSKAQLSSIGIEVVRKVVDWLKPIELSPSNRFRTYQLMLMDDAIFSGIDSRKVLISRAQSGGYLKFKKDSPISVVVKDFLQYNIDNLQGQSMRSIGTTAASMIENGTSLFEKVLIKGKGQYSDKWTIQKLSPIHPLTLDPSKPFTVADDGDSYINANQSSSAFTGTGGVGLKGSKVGLKGVKEIPWAKICYSSYASDYSQILGCSPLDAIYNVWREKVLLQDITKVGVTKDMAGMPVIEIPIDILDKSAADENSQEARLVNGLQEAMANMHQGDQAFVILPSDTISESGQGAKQYNLRFLGVDGGGKQFDLVQLIEQRRRAILTVLGAQHLSVGENGTGGMNLLEGKSDMQAFYAERDITIIEEMWNKDVFPQLMRINGWVVSKEDMPEWVSGEIQPISLDEKGKYINRVGRMLPAIPDVVNKILEDAGIDYRVAEGTTPAQIREMGFAFVEPDKVGSGEGSSGTGSKVQSNSDTNSENAA